MKPIVWTPQALRDYDDNLDHLLKEWGVESAQKFIDNLSAAQKQIQQMPELYPVKYKDVRKAVLHKRVSLLYRPTKISIEIIRLWNNSWDEDHL